ncbi:MAG: DUF3078 domain-containing protein [Bacteroidetes bacterium]|nr:DUF3078 domain-containing protein [Bacteroidota bacterium]
MIKTKILIFSFLLLNSGFLFCFDWIIDQKVLIQFEEMLYNNWEGTGSNYVSGSVRFIGSYNNMSDDSTFKLINNVEAAIGTAYNSTDKWMTQEDKISANSSANQKLLDNFYFNGTADLKSRFDLSSTYLLAALGINFISGDLSIQNNPITLRSSFIRTEGTFDFGGNFRIKLENSIEFGNYFKIAWKGNLDTNITAAVKLENFYKYGQAFLKESFWNLETMTSFQINKLISSHLIINALYDAKQSKKLQAFEKITIGFTWKI